MLRVTRTPSPARQRVPSTLRFTELAPGDTATIRAVFDGLSARSRYLRFHAGRAMLPIQMQRLLADIRPGRHQAHVAVLDDRPVGIARWIRYAEDPQSAELAIEVIDAAQSVGIGHQLARHAAESAQAAGVELFLAYVDESNQDLRERTLSYGAAVDPHDRSLLRLPVASLLAEVAGPVTGLRKWRRC